MRTFPRLIFLLSLAALLLPAIPSTVRGQSVADGHEVDVFGGNVHTVSRDGRGRVLIGGDFNQVGAQTRNRVALLSPNGTLDTLFNPNIGNGMVLDSLVDRDGMFVFVGSFTTPHSRIARYFFDGEADSSFGVTINATVRAVVEDPDSGRLYIGGDFTQVGLAARSRVARLNPNGSADSSFVPVEFSGAVRALALQPDGKLIVAGNIQRVGDIAARRIYRLNSDGSWDSSFMVTQLIGSPHQIRAVAVQDDGKILIGGDFPGHLRRYLSNGALDTDFSPPALNGPVYSIELQPDGRALVGGDFTGIEGGRLRVIRLLESGALDTGFLTFPSPGAAVRAIELHPDGGMMIAGDFTQFADNGRNRVARLNASGRIDRDLRLTAFDASNFSRVRALAEGPNGSLYVGGNFSRIGGVNRTHLARILSDGTVDPSFQPTLNAFVGAIHVQPDGRILVGGGFGQVNGAARTRLVRLMPDGSIDGSFANGLAGSDGRIYAIAVQEDGRIVVAGDIRNVATGRRGAARLHPNGSLDASFSIADVNDFIRTLVIDPQGRALIGGRFTQIDGFPRPGLARLLPSGLLDPSFAPAEIQTSNGTGSVNALALRQDHLLVGGTFIEINGQSCPRLARLSLTGHLQQCANAVPGLVMALAERADGRFYASGFDSSWDGNTAWVQLFDSVGTQTPGFTTVTSPLRGDLMIVGALAVLNDGRLALGGRFSELGGQTRGGVARLRLDDDLRQELTWDTDSQQVFWSRGALNQPRIGAEPIGRPRVLVSQTCCDPTSFSAPPGGGWMQRTQLGNWTLDDFAGLPGRFFMLVEARVGDASGTGTYTLRTPIHRFEGPPLPPVLADLWTGFGPSTISPNPGDTVAVKLDVENHGPSPASGIEALLQFGSGVELLGFSVTQGDFDPETGSWRIGELPAGLLTATITMSLRIHPEGEHAVSVEVLGDQVDPDYSNNSASLVVDVQLRRSNLQLVKTVSPVLALPEDMVEFELQLGNTGPEAAEAVRVQNQMPSGYSWRGLLSADGSYDPGTGLWDVGQLAVGQSVTLRFAADLTNTGEYTSVAVASSDSLDVDPNGNLAIAAIEPFTDVTVLASSAAQNVGLKEAFSVAIEVINQGPMAARDTVLQLSGSCFAVNSGTASQGSFANLQWQIGTLGRDDEEGWSYAVLILEARMNCDIMPAVVTGTVSSSTRDPVPGNNSASVTVNQDRIFGNGFEPPELCDLPDGRGC